jgi:probable rRNA maturation factor
MSYEIQVQTDSRWQDYEHALIQSARQTLAHQSVVTGSLTIVLTDANRVRDLNVTFAGEDHATDVLSFTDGSEDPESGQLYFGDVIIAVDIAEKQAQKAGHTLSAELSLLTVHGVLHLLGHDHADEDEKRSMWAAQKEILDSLEIHLKRWPFENE